jgi:hypothetical protein
MTKLQNTSDISAPGYAPKRSKSWNSSRCMHVNIHNSAVQKVRVGKAQINAHQWMPG